MSTESKDVNQKCNSESGSVGGYTPDFTEEKCELFSIDFAECQITLDVSPELLKNGLHAGTLKIDFTPLIK